MHSSRGKQTAVNKAVRQRRASLGTREGADTTAQLPDRRRQALPRLRKKLESPSSTTDNDGVTVSENNLTVTL